MTSAAVEGIEGMPTAVDLLEDFETWTAHIFQPPGWEWVDPQKEQKASAEAIASNLSTLSDECGKRGKDWRDVVEQRATEEAFIKSLGLLSVVTKDQPPALDQTQEELDLEEASAT